MKGLEKGAFVPAIMAAVLSAILGISLLHGENALAYEYKTAGKFFNVLTWVSWAAAAVAPAIMIPIAKNVKSDRRLQWIAIAVLGGLLLLGLFSMVGFRYNDLHNPHI